jgi:hypothetical protein
MTTYIVPCGLSIRDGLSNPKKRTLGPAGARVKPFRDAEKQWWPQARVELGERLVESWAAALADLAADAKLAEWEYEVCAETSTLSKRTVTAGLATLLERGDHVVLLASDTDEGMAAALSVAYLVAGADHGRIRCVAAPIDDTAAEGFRASVPAGAVTVVRVGGLAPNTELRTAVAGIGRVLRVGYDLGEPMEVHLTGGYKITLLHTLAMTEIAYSRAPDRTSAWYIFDEAGAGVVPIGLRRFPQGHLRGMRTELTTAKRGQRPLDGDLEGLGWELTGDRKTPRLTDFGEGFLAVLGGPEMPGTNDGGR